MKAGIFKLDAAFGFKPNQRVAFRFGSDLTR